MRRHLIGLVLLGTLSWASQATAGPVEKVQNLLAFDGPNLDEQGFSITDARIGVLDEGDLRSASNKVGRAGA